MEICIGCPAQMPHLIANPGGANVDRLRTLDDNLNPRSIRPLAAALGLGMLRRGSSYTGTRMHMNGFGGQRFTAFRADHYGIEHLLAAVVFVQQRPSARVDHVDVAPVPY